MFPHYHQQESADCGPCPRSRDEMLRHNGFINCNIESPDDYWNQKILDYCHSFEKKIEV